MKKRGRKKRRENRWAVAGSFCGPRCPECGEKTLYFFAYDTDCCPHCDVWLTPLCNDANCSFCAHRPRTPALALELAEAEACVERLRGQKAVLQNRYLKRASGRSRRRRAERLRCHSHKKEF